MTGARSYKTLTLFGLIAAIWFAALAKGAHDLWAATALFAWLTLIVIIFLAGSCRRQNRVAVSFMGCFSLLLMAFFVSSRFSFDMNTTRLELWIWFFSGAAFFLFVNIFHDPDLRFRFLTFGGLVILPVALGAAAQYGRDLPAFFHSHWAAESTFTNSAVLAGFALSWVFLFWYLRKKSPVYHWLFAACLLTLLLARSWWGFISLLIGFMFYYKNHIKIAFKSRRIEVLSLGLPALAFLILAFFYKLGPWQDPIYRATDRLSWWWAGLRMAKEHPWAGVGLGSYGTAFPYFKAPVILNTLYAHSFPIQLLSETGLFGCLGILLFAILYVRDVSTNRRQSGEWAAYQATVFTLLCFSMTTIFLEYFIGKLMLLMSMALSLSSMNLKTVTISKRMFYGLVAGLLLVSPSWYLPLRASQYYVDGLRYENQVNEPMAETAYKKALALNAYEDESCTALVHLYERRYHRSHSLLDLSTFMFWTQQASSMKKLPRPSRELAY